MRDAKKKKLEAAGWKFGEAADFLELSPEERTLVEMKANLAMNLHALRDKRGLTQSGAAKLLHSSQSRVAKMEAGDASVSLDLLIRALVRLGATSRDLASALHTGASAPAHRVREREAVYRAGGSGKIKKAGKAK